MKLLFLGTGSALTVGSGNFHSNMLFISETQETLLVDCGSDARLSLHQQQMSHRDIKNVYISHLHGDHAGGLEWLALAKHFDPACTEKPCLFIVDALVADLWNRTLSGGLSTLQFETASLDTFFDVRAIPVNGNFTWENITFQLVQTIHVINSYSLMPSFGLLCNINDMTVWITTDIQFLPDQMYALYERSDIIFHDCDTSAAKCGVHAHYDQLQKLPKKLKEKMWLYHYDSNQLPDARADGFRGFIKCGQWFDFNDPATLL